MHAVRGHVGQDGVGQCLPRRGLGRRRAGCGDRAQAGHAHQPGLGPALVVQFPHPGVRVTPAGFDGRDRRLGGPPVRRCPGGRARPRPRTAAAHRPGRPAGTAGSPSYRPCPSRPGSRPACDSVRSSGTGAAADRVGGLEVRPVVQHPVGDERDRVVEQLVRPVGGYRPARCSTGPGSRRSGSRSCGPPWPAPAATWWPRPPCRRCCWSARPARRSCAGCRATRQARPQLGDGVSPGPLGGLPRGWPGRPCYGATARLDSSSTRSCCSPGVQRQDQLQCAHPAGPWPARRRTSAGGAARFAQSRSRGPTSAGSSDAGRNRPGRPARP